MAAPKFSPVRRPTARAAYASPDHVPEAWMPDRPGEIEGFQPDGPRLGDPGPRPGVRVAIAAQLRPKLQLQPGEHADDAIRGCLGGGAARASMLLPCSVVHDLTIAFTDLGLLRPDSPAELVELRRAMFEGLRPSATTTPEARAVADLPPDATLRMTPAQVVSTGPPIGARCSAV